ncbi:hypothetical protein [Variovorax fucosicus]|uniref:hypothetical protein n=1 Tax=Variovorax fucosicus TaxID=3053517 RepID=UPI002575805E|nr:hypothetical protein [Variovorax sp. J22G47]MDM0057077.1 hypothetical protein [Variovorax sp. J22G47]
MQSTWLRRFVTRHFAGWCLAALCLAALQPLLAVHFRVDGWEDEPGLRVRGADVTRFEPDERSGHADTPEVTLFVPSAATIDLPHALQHGLDLLMALVGLLLPLLVALRRLGVPWQPPLPAALIRRSRAPPLAAPWRRRPPTLAPPLSN